MTHTHQPFTIADIAAITLSEPDSAICRIENGAPAMMAA